MFDLDAFLADCRQALREGEPRRAVRELLARHLERRDEIAESLGRPQGGIEVLSNAEDLTVVNVVWAPGMAIYPHDHRMWAVIGLYGGAEDNTLYQRAPGGIRAAGLKELRDGDVFAIGADAIHAVRNPLGRLAGAIHVYGGDFVNQPRSQWDPDTLLEQPYDAAQVARAFAAANKAWTEQLGRDLDIATG